MSLVLGLDIGGTHSRARLACDGETLAEAKAGSASLTAAGADAAAEALEQLIADLDLSSHGPLDAVCAGSAGSGSPEAVDFLRRHLAPLTRTGTVLVVNDARLVLPAAGLEDGIAVISGTGSMCIGVLNGREARAGGLGYVLGDEGSGFWVVREAIRTLAGRSDREEPLGQLGDDLLAAAGAADLPDLIQRFYDNSNPDGWARHAGVVLGSADPAAQEILLSAGTGAGRVRDDGRRNARGTAGSAGGSGRRAGDGTPAPGRGTADGGRERAATGERPRADRAARAGSGATGRGCRDLSRG